MHLHSRLYTCLEWIGQRQLQENTKIISVLGVGGTCIICFTVCVSLQRWASFIISFDLSCIHSFLAFILYFFLLFRYKYQKYRNIWVTVNNDCFVTSGEILRHLWKPLPYRLTSDKNPLITLTHTAFYFLDAMSWTHKSAKTGFDRLSRQRLYHLI